MTIEEVKKRDYIYGFLYANPKPTVVVNDETGETEIYPSKLYKISLHSSNIHLYDDSIVEIWGWPGPDSTTYYLKDYKKTWCFEPEEIPDAPIYAS